MQDECERELTVCVRGGMFVTFLVEVFSGVQWWFSARCGAVSTVVYGEACVNCALFWLTKKKK